MGESLRKQLPELYGGLQEEEKNPSGELLKPILVASVNVEVFSKLLLGELDFIIWDNSPFSTSRLYTRAGQHKKYNLIKIASRRPSHVSFIIAEYQGFFTAKSNHELTMAGIKSFVLNGSYILKIGKILQSGTE